MSLHYLVKLEIIIAHMCYTIELSERETPKFIPP